MPLLAHLLPPHLLRFVLEAVLSLDHMAVDMVVERAGCVLGAEQALPICPSSSHRLAVAEAAKHPGLDGSTI